MSVVNFLLSGGDLPKIYYTHGEVIEIKFFGHSVFWLLTSVFFQLSFFAQLGFNYVKTEYWSIITYGFCLVSMYPMLVYNLIDCLPGGPLDVFMVCLSTKILGFL